MFDPFNLEPSLQASERVAIDLLSNGINRQYMVTPRTDQTARANERDVILMCFGFHLSDNRWKATNQPIDYTAIQISLGWVDLNKKLLRRIKLYRLPSRLAATDQAELLRCLANHFDIQQLEIGELSLLPESWFELTFKSLRVLSIDRIRIERGEWTGRPCIQIKAPKLKAIYSGVYPAEAQRDFYPKNPLLTGHFKFVSYQSGGCNLVRLHVPDVPSVLDLIEDAFQNLRVLVCTGYRHESRFVVERIVQGHFLPELVDLCFNFDSDSLELNTGELILLAGLYNYLVNLAFGREKPPPKESLRIYFRGLRFDPLKPFVGCGFEKRLVKFHFDNLLTGGQVKVCPGVCRIDYLDVLDTFLSPGRRFPDIAFFFRIYPNLREIVVNNEFRRRQLSAVGLTMFLGACSCLTGLELHYAALDANSSVAAKVLRQDFLGRLNSLVVFEQAGQFQERINFPKLLKDRFMLLQNFQTNLATKTMMFRMLETMHVNAEFEFRFWTKNLGQPRNYNRCIVWRGRPSSYYLIAIVHQNGFDSEVRNSFDDLAAMRQHLDRIKERFSLDHWLDRKAVNQFSTCSRYLM